MGLFSFFTKIFGTASERKIKKLMPIVDEINEIYEGLSDVSQEELRERTANFQKLVQNKGEEARQEAQAQGLSEQEIEEEAVEAEQEVLKEILPEAYAIVKETCRKMLGEEWKAAGHKIKWKMVPYDVQLVGGIVLHQNSIAEMKTGEGKTLAATMPVYLNALTGRGVHVVTVNDYLAQRDSEWVGKIYEELGLSVGCILNEMTPDQRKEVYDCDIVYGTNNEFGFDYLRDNMAIDPDKQVQRGYYYCIVDEIDNILIDEARTPLIISGPVADSRHDKFNELNPAVSNLVRLQKGEITSLLSGIPLDSSQLDEEDKKELPRKLYTASRGQPKHRRLRKLLEDTTYQKLKKQGEKEFLLLTGSKNTESISKDEYFEDLYFYIEEQQNALTLTPKGEERLAKLLNIEVDDLVVPDLSEQIVDVDNDDSLSEDEKQKKKMELEKKHAEISDRYHNLSQLLKAHSLFEKDNEYVVKDGKVLIVDEFTGRILPGRRYSDGLHQALEAKENVTVEAETQTYATITLQNYFRMYSKLSGMTGTAKTEEGEFQEIYDLDVVVIPTNEPVIRKDHEDQIYKTKREKYNAIVNEVVQRNKKGQPILLGTVSVEVSETLSRMLKRKKIPHNVLNAKHHQREAEIISNAGQKGSVTIATNMAGRGTDIQLGEGVREVGGLYVIGSERHESRRIDLQLRGRSGRQGDPGASRFYLSLEDDLMRLFNSDRIVNVMDKLGIEEGEVITHGMVTKSIERAQKKVEERNFAIRKHLLEYDDVMNQQREVIYDRRNYALHQENTKERIFGKLEDWIDGLLAEYTDEKDMPEAWNWDAIRGELIRILGFDYYPNEGKQVTIDKLRQNLLEKAKRIYNKKEEYIGSEEMRQIENFVSLKVIDEEWKDHLYAMEQLKEGINWRAY
ncbi:MAG: preprotein translocase subunit SecA, partial [Candidatus Marinimicrobia bacterium]|nr:preprotein translocase subunit SecA [Candidatus Neomarinimicrobiota bacterium]